MIALSLRWFPTVPLVKYPGISASEGYIASEFLRKNPLSLTSISYSIPLLSPIPVGFNCVKNCTRMWDYLTALKCDAYALSSRSNFLIEFKEKALPSSVYQLLSYAKSFGVNFTEEPTPSLVLVCQWATHTALDMALDSNISIITV